MPDTPDYQASVGIQPPGAVQYPQRAEFERTLNQELERLQYTLTQATAIFAREAADQQAKEAAVDAAIQGESHALEASLALQDTWARIRDNPAVGTDDLLPTLAEREKKIRETAIKSVSQYGKAPLGRFLQEYTPRVLSTFTDAQNERYGRWRSESITAHNNAIQLLQQDVEEGRKTTAEGVAEARFKVGRIPFLTTTESVAALHSALTGVYKGHINRYIRTTENGRYRFVHDIANDPSRLPTDPVEREAFMVAYKEEFGLVGDAHTLLTNEQHKQERDFKIRSRALFVKNHQQVGIDYGMSDYERDLPSYTPEDASSLRSFIETMERAGGHRGNDIEGAKLVAKLWESLATLRDPYDPLAWNETNLKAEIYAWNLNVPQTQAAFRTLEEVRGVQRALQTDQGAYKRMPYYQSARDQLFGYYGIPEGPNMNFFHPSAVALVRKAAAEWDRLLIDAYREHMRDPRNPAVTPALMDGLADIVKTHVKLSDIQTYMSELIPVPPAQASRPEKGK